MSSGSKNALEQLRNNYDWALKVADKELLFSKDIDSYKFFYLLLMEQKAPVMLLKDMLELEAALHYNVNTEMIFDRKKTDVPLEKGLRIKVVCGSWCLALRV